MLTMSPQPHASSTSSISFECTSNESFTSAKSNNIETKKCYSIDELMKMRTINHTQPLNLIQSPVINDILRTDLNVLPTQLTFLHMDDTIQCRLRQFQHQRNRHRSNEDLNGRAGHSAKRQNRQNNNNNNNNCSNNNNNENSIRSSSSSEIRIRLRIQDDVKLHKAPNAWTPSSFVEQKPIENSADELYRHVRSILNKLTEQNFKLMLDQFKEFVIDSKEKLDGVTDLVFNKAVNEPKFSVGYAHLCLHLSSCSDKMQIDFKRSIITKCQHEFEQNVANQHTMDAALQPLNERLREAQQLNDEKRCNEIKCQIIDEEAMLRRRLVSTVRFIGALYNCELLTNRIMNWCINSLISGTDEKLECLCKLLTTIGEKLEGKSNANVDTASKKQQQQPLDLTLYMQQLRTICVPKNGKPKIGTRIRFMIMDLIDLRANHWVSKR